MDSKHEKHTKLSRPNTGEFNRHELAILGTTCGNIRNLANIWIQALSRQYRIAFVDADHKAPETDADSALAHGAALEFTDRISYRSFNYQQEFNKFQNQSLFNGQDLVLINGNHFKAQSQIVVVDPIKPLDKKLDKLTQVVLVLLAEGVTTVPEYLQPYTQHIPVLSMNNTEAITGFIRQYITENLPPLYGLVLAGGKSQRMAADKGSIAYFGKSQRLHVHELLSQHCQQVYVSYADEQAIHHDEQLPVVLDTFTGLGPYSGILSAFRTNTNAAWITLACDLPYLSPETLAYLVQHRNSSKIATAFMDAENKFPEPLITIWEPRAYPVLLQFLSQGYSCPRKVLINSDVELLTVPDVRELQNANYPEDRERALQYLQEIKSV
ncbi:NTP transferase domain-containing protein [Mucilaginibacter robiniae]|uniref:Probable molybdenum cofactor guanylyltransferase n=1 Tax=Mucilaginibacter robiniae TaxID=2728022 RepID=A0A7L5DWY1_9SPHI|nr:NTP transferase domain-containing protein [Mucilaginibacter robiniae]QJD95602.1 NTP transferase domain-containing protein [Mucilaginibacter robiniae]